MVDITSPQGLIDVVVIVFRSIVRLQTDVLPIFHRKGTTRLNVEDDY